MSAAPDGAPRWLVIQHHGIQVEVEPEGGGPSKRLRVKRRAGLVVGDVVIEDNDKVEKLPRQTELARRAAGGYGKQAVAANLGLLGIVVTAMPPPRVGLIDRAIVAAREGGITPMVIVNKADLGDVPAWADALRAELGGGVDVLLVSSRGGDGLQALRTRLSDAGLAAFVGPSGVGKSSLTRTLVPAADVEVGALSEATGRGKHTTTRSTLWRHAGIALIDTPGIRDFGLVTVAPEDLAHFFAGFERVPGDCRFRNCLHRGEPGCAIAAAQDDGVLPEGRLAAYRRLLSELEEEAERAGT
jgi:ribosome biogenesis GTPase